MRRRACYRCRRELPEAGYDVIPFVVLSLGDTVPMCIQCTKERRYKIVRLEKVEK